MKSILPGCGPYPRINTRQGIPSPAAPDRPRVIAKLILDTDGTLPIWPVDTSGAPHHEEMKYSHGVNHPTVDGHVYQDGTFAIYSHRGLTGDPKVAADTIENGTGLNWRGKSVEEVEGKQDGHAGNPWMSSHPQDAVSGNN